MLHYNALPMRSKDCALNLFNGLNDPNSFIHQCACFRLTSGSQISFGAQENFGKRQFWEYYCLHFFGFCFKFERTQSPNICIWFSFTSQNNLRQYRKNLTPCLGNNKTYKLDREPLLAIIMSAGVRPFGFSIHSALYIGKSLMLGILVT